MITSVRNARIQWIRKLQAQPRFRREENAFVAEGVRLIEEAVLSKWDILLVLFTQGLDERGQELVKKIQDTQVPVEEATPNVFKSASDTQTPQGILAVLSLPAVSLPSNADILLIADGVRDPGNLGTILRTATAAGLDAVLLPPGTADAYSPKVVRAGMGAHFSLPVLSTDWDEIRRLLSQMKETSKIYLADAADGEIYTNADFTKPLVLIVGGEAQGAGTHAADLMHTRVHIPMPGEVESLNVAVAAAILMFEVVRQRTSDRPKP